MEYFNCKNEAAFKKISAAEARSITTGSKNIKVGIIDSGIYPHENLKNNISPGWNFINNNNKTHEDITGHGTNVAGIIGAAPFGREPIGLCRDISLVPLKVINEHKELEEDAVIRAIDYAVKNNILILNFCYSLTNYNEKLYNAIRSYRGLFICSAGNDGKNIGIYKKYPASFPLSNIITVSACDETDSPLANSNYGKNTVHIAAPGERILTTNTSSPTQPKFITRGGTSIAAPYVTAAAALIKSLGKNEKPQRIKEKILSSADNILILYGKVSSRGRLNVYKCLCN